MIKKLITAVICLLITLLVFLKQDYITGKIIDFVNNVRQPEFSETISEYTRGFNYEYVSITDDFTPYNYQDLLNILYTALDKRYNSITFYCPREYEECLNDVERLSSNGNQDELTIIGNLVSSFNNFTNISVYYDTSGKVKYDIAYSYDSDDIAYVNEELDNIMNTTINDSMTLEEKIRALHDYLVEYAEYDTNYEYELDVYGKGTLESNTSVGFFKNKLAICTGYADTMGLLLDRLGVYNYKVTSDTHIWNAVKLDNQYLHLDVTWDDPTNNIFHLMSTKYYLIDTNTLLTNDTESHNFDKTIYLELAQ